MSIFRLHFPRGVHEVKSKQHVCISASQMCKFLSMKNRSFARFPRTFFIFVHFEAVPRREFAVVWQTSALNWPQIFTFFLLLSRNRSHQFDSRILSAHLASQIAWNSNRKLFQNIMPGRGRPLLISQRLHYNKINCDAKTPQQSFQHDNI